MTLEIEHPQNGPISREQISRTDTGYVRYDDQAALTLIEQDAARCDNYITLNNFAGQWLQADELYQSPQKTSPYGGNRTQGDDIPRFTLSNHISSIVPKMMGGIFYETPPFMLRPRPNVTQDVVRAKTAVLTTQLDEMSFEEQVELAFDQCSLLGTGVFKWGWLETEKTEKKRVRKEQPQTIKTPFSSHQVDTEKSDEFEIKPETKKVFRPWIKWCDVRHVLVDPACRVGDIRKAKYVIYRDYVTFSDLDKLRTQPGYNIPAQDDLLSLFFPPEKKDSGPDNQAVTLPENLRAYIQHSTPRNLDTSADPLLHPIEILERCDKEHWMVALRCGGGMILIYNDENPYHCINYYSFNWRTIPDCFYGMGLGKLIGNDQRVEQGALNAALNILRYSSKPTYLRKKGLNAPTQQIRQTLSGIIDVDDDVDKAFKIIELPKTPSEVWMVIQQAQSSAAATSGANEAVVQGAASAGVKTTGMRSGTGAAAVIQANASRLDGPVGRFVRQVFEPWLWQMDELNNDLLPTSALREILDDKMEKDFEVDHEQYRNAKLEFEVLAGSRLGPKKEMTQLLPFMLQMMNNPPAVQSLADNGERFDFNAIFHAFTELAGWKYSQQFVVPIKPEDQAKQQANSPAGLQAAKAQQGQQAEQQKFAQDQELLEQKNLGKAMDTVIAKSIEASASNEAIEGEPGNKGLGGTEV